MAVTYCTVSDVADLIRIPIDETSVPNITQVEKLINRNEAKIDRRTGHAWREVTVTNEIHDLPLLYTFGWGTPIFLQHRNIKTLDSGSGDKIEIWQGAASQYEDILANTEFYDIEPVYGVLHLRGYIFSILRKRRVRVTYRYGDSTVPLDIEEACAKLTAIDLLRGSFRMDPLPMGAKGINPETTAEMWKRDVDKIIRDREEVFFIP